MENGMVVFCIVGDYDNAPAASCCFGMQLLHESEESPGIEILLLAPIYKSAVAQPDGPKIANALPSWMMQ